MYGGCPCPCPPPLWNAPVGPDKPSDGEFAACVAGFMVWLALVGTVAGVLGL